MSNRRGAFPSGLNQRDGPTAKEKTARRGRGLCPECGRALKNRGELLDVVTGRNAVIVLCPRCPWLCVAYKGGALYRKLVKEG